MPNKFNARILVADDNRFVLNMVCRMLSALGCETTGTIDGLEALNRFQREGFDLVLTDLQMPIMDGWELAERIKSLAPNVPVIAMTGMDRDEVLERQRKSALDHVVFKPLNLDALDNALASAMEPRQLNRA